MCICNGRSSLRVYSCVYVMVDQVLECTCVYMYGRSSLRVYLCVYVMVDQVLELII